MMRDIVWTVALVGIIHSVVVQGNFGSCTNWTTTRECNPTAQCSQDNPRNLIIISPTTAGMSDRSFIVKEALIFGGALCARILIPPPYMMLLKKHNRFKPIDCSWKWSRYWDIESYEQRLLQWPDEVLNTTIGDQMCIYPHKKNKEILVESLLSYTESMGYKTVSNIKDCLDMYVNGTSFSIIVDGIELFNKQFRGQCENIFNHDFKVDTMCSRYNITYGGPSGHNSMRISPLVKNIANAIVEGIEKYIIIHIRRTDTLTSKKYAPCDNSAPKVNLLLKCINKRLSSRASENNFEFPSILFSTDETDEMYLNNITSIMSQYSKQVIYLDNITKQHLKSSGYETDDNYLIYEVFQQITSFNHRYYSFGGHDAKTAEKCKMMTQCNL